MRFKDRDTGEERVKTIPVKNLDAVLDGQIAPIKKLTKKGEEALRRAEVIERKVIRAKLAGAEEEPGPLTGDIVCEMRGRRLVPRLHVRKGGASARS